MENNFTATEDDAGTRADIYLSGVSGHSRSRIKKLIDEGCIHITDKKKLKASYPVEAGDVFFVTTHEKKEPDFLPEDIPIDIVYEDEHLLVVNKSTNMVVHPGRGNQTGTLASGLLYHCKYLSGIGGEQRPGIVHRLDKETSGLLLVALNDDVHVKLSGMLERREIKRIYTAFVWGHPEPAAGTIDAPLGRNQKKPMFRAVVRDGRNAVTHYETLALYDYLTKLRVELQTGRTHQIRVHLAHIGHHVFGDASYGGREELLKGFSPEVRTHARRSLKIITRQALHAGQLSLIHPVTNEELTVEAPLPEDMLKLEASLH